MCLRVKKLYLILPMEITARHFARIYCLFLAVGCFFNALGAKGLCID